ncbi:MAG: cell division protein FtsQ [Acidimicrobiaceae bacterium]
MTVAETGQGTTAIDPRLRARRIAVRRSDGRRRLRRLTGLGVAAAVAVLALGVTRSPVLDVDRVRVTGATHTTVDAVQHAAGIRTHAPMTDVDLDRARQGVLALPWVQSVSVTRSWPASVRIVITERTAVAVVTAGTAGFALVDGDGRVLELSVAPPAGFMLLANVPLPGPPGSTIDPSAGDALSVARAMPASLRPKVSTVVAQADGVELRLVAGGVVRLGPATDLGSKLRAADTVLGEVDTTNLCALDVRVASAPSLTRGKSCL